MTSLQILVIIFLAFAISRVLLRLRSRELSLWSGLVWLALWLAIAVGAFSVRISTELAALVGVGRGADVAFFGAIIVMFYLLFRIYIKLDRVDRDITEVIIKSAIKDHTQA